MKESNLESLPPPPGVVSSLRAGFDAIASHIAAILLPLILDLWLWLGPRLSMETLYHSLEPDFVAAWKMLGIPLDQIQQLNAQNAAGLSDLNLFWALRTFPVGVTSLMVNRTFQGTPLGIQHVWQVASADNLVLDMMFLVLAGWVMGGVYFHWVSKIVKTGEQRNAGFLHAVLQTALYSLIWVFFLFALSLPVALFLLLLSGLNGLIINVVLVFLIFFSMWLVVPLFFSPHGIFVDGQNAFSSIMGGVRLARFTLPTSSMFVLTVFLLGIGLNFLWSIPPTDSWMTLVGILGHAFITTALLAASFIYYRDMTAWLKIMLERFKANAVTTREA